MHRASRKHTLSVPHTTAGPTHTHTCSTAARVQVKGGDLATFPNGMTCRWEVSEPIEKKYNFI